MVRPAVSIDADLMWGVGEYYNSVAESRDVDEIQCGSIFDRLEHVLAPSDGDRCQQKVELVDQAVLHQCGIEWAISVFDDVAPRLLLQVGHTVSRRVVDATYLGIVFIRSMRWLGAPESSPVMVG
jgi:hypothetical protein